MAQVKDYFDELSKSVDDLLNLGVNELKEEIEKIARNKNINISNQKLNEACQKLFQRTRSNFEKNIVKFQLYSQRNIFNNKVNVTGVSSSSSSKNETPVKKPQNKELDRKLQELRTNYLSLRNEYLTVATECRDTDILLKEMRHVLFDIKVAIQHIDDYETHQLSEIASSINENRSKLLFNKDKAEALVKRIEEFQKSKGADPPTETKATEEEGTLMDIEPLLNTSTDTLTKLTDSLNQN